MAQNNALNKSSEDFTVDNLFLDGNTISTTDTDGDLNLTATGDGDLNSNYRRTLITYSSVGSAVLVKATNSDNTNTLSNAACSMDVGGTSGGDPYYRCAVGTAYSVCWGLDNDNSDILKMGFRTDQNVSPSNANVFWQMTTAGERTMPLQPAFNAIVNTAGTNVTGDGTLYTIVFDGEMFDQNSDYNTGTGVFTAPVTGKYCFAGEVIMTGLTSSHTQGEVILNISSGGRTLINLNFYAISVSGQLWIPWAYGPHALTAADTVSVQLRVSGGTKVVDVANNPACYFAGSLAC